MEKKKKKTIKLILEVEVDIDGKVPSDDLIESALCDALSENMPSLILDSEDLDCQIFTETWSYEGVKQE